MSAVIVALAGVMRIWSKLAGSPVALKVTGEPDSEPLVAVRVLEPAVVPRVQLPTVAMPAGVGRLREAGCGAAARGHGESDAHATDRVVVGVRDEDAGGGADGRAHDHRLRVAGVRSDLRGRTGRAGGTEGHR